MSRGKQEPIDASDPNRPSSSLPTSVWTLFTALLLGFTIFSVPWWPSAFLAVLPMVSVFLVNATASISGRVSAHLSLPILGLAILMPAIRLASDLLFGYGATLFSFLGIGFFKTWGSSGEELWYPIACWAGLLVNVTFLVGYISFLSGAIRLARWTASIGFCLSVFVTVALALSTELNGIYLGHGLWMTSLLALSLGSWRMEATVRGQ